MLTVGKPCKGGGALRGTIAARGALAPIGFCCRCCGAALYAWYIAEALPCRMCDDAGGEAHFLTIGYLRSHAPAGGMPHAPVVVRHGHLVLHILCPVMLPLELQQLAASSGSAETSGAAAPAFVANEDMMATARRSGAASVCALTALLHQAGRSFWAKLARSLARLRGIHAYPDGSLAEDVADACCLSARSEDELAQDCLAAVNGTSDSPRMIVIMRRGLSQTRAWHSSHEPTSEIRTETLSKKYEAKEARSPLDTSASQPIAEGFG